MLVDRPEKKPFAAKFLAVDFFRVCVTICRIHIASVRVAGFHKGAWR